MSRFADPMTLTRGPAWKNRLALAPLTNLQSHADGTLSDDELHWLEKRAEGGFSLVMTCAAHVAREGQGFPGQLGIWSDAHLPGLTRLAGALRARGAVSCVQLHHAGRRAPAELTGQQPVCAWDDAETGARALTADEAEAAVEAFVLAGLRAEAAGFDGVEIHGAHGYLVGQFLDADNNQRTDGWGGSPAGRSRFLRAVIAGLRSRARPDFQIGVRVSPERFGIDPGECRALVGDLMAGGAVDWIDLSLWDVFKAAVAPQAEGRALLDLFVDLPRHGTRLGAAGRLMDAPAAAEALARGLDFVLLGRAAILHHDFAARAMADPAFASAPLPVTRAHLAGEGLGPAFVDYMATWKGFVA